MRCLRLLAVVAVFALSMESLGQSSDTPSLGDLARKQREKQEKDKASATKPKKVVTDEDMPAQAADEDVPPSDGSHEEMSTERSARDVLQSGDQFKSAIARQKGVVTDLKARIDKLNASIHFVEANAYSNGVEYNKLQAHKQQEAERLQRQLDEQKRHLEQLQEKARNAGYASAVWDP
jgi:predicted RNase H-like nuclease (RuvC/YqgF family)